MAPSVSGIGFSLVWAVILFMALTACVVAVATLPVGRRTLAKYWLLPKRTTTLAVWAKSISPAEKNRLRKIFTEVMEQGYVNPITYRTFWAILGKEGALPMAEVQKLRNMATGTATVYQRYFYQDALTSLRSGTPYKSSQREQYEKYLLSLGLISQSRLRKSDQLIATITAQKSIPYKKTTVVMDEGVINEILTSLNMAEKGLDRLFTPPDARR